jgi:phospholipase/carboxylesterase
MQSKVVETKTLPCVLVQPESNVADGSLPLVILMHGFGADMYDLAGFAPELDESGYIYAFPNAPYRFAGSTASSWFADREGVVQPPTGAPSLDELLEGFVADITGRTETRKGNVVLGGFSQGGGVTLRHGLSRPDSFRALVVLSGAFRGSDEVKAALPTVRTQPIFIAHGRSDRTIPLERALETRKFLEEAGYHPEFHEYDMGHTISGATTKDLSAWLHANVPPA